MLNESKIEELIDKATKDMNATKDLFGKEVYQKRFKPVFEGYITALATVTAPELDAMAPNITPMAKPSGIL